MLRYANVYFDRIGMLFTKFFVSLFFTIVLPILFSVRNGSNDGKNRRENEPIGRKVIFLQYTCLDKYKNKA